MFVYSFAASTFERLLESTSRAETVALCLLHGPEEVVLEELILSFYAVVCNDGSTVHRITIGIYIATRLLIGMLSTSEPHNYIHMHTM